MKRLVRAMPVALVVLATAVLALPALAQGVDWPQFQGGAAHPGIAAGPQPGLAEAWTYEGHAGGPGARFGLSAPVIAGGLVIAVGPEEVVAVGVDDGVGSWTSPKVLGPSVPGAVPAGDDPVFIYTQGWGDGPPEPAGAVSPTPSASPIATPSPAEDGAAPTPSRLVAIGMDDRDQRWSVDLPDVSRSGVTVIGDLAVVGSNDGSVTAVEIASGDTAWTTDVGGAVDVPPAAEGGLIVVSTRATVDATTALVGLAVADGAERWRFAPETAAPFAGPPTIAGGSVYAGFSDRSIYAVAAEDGAARWSARINGSAPLSPLVVTSSAVLAVDVGTFGSQLYALDPATGRRRWDHPLGVPVFRAAPVVVGDAVVTGAIDGRLRAFDLTSGDLIWYGPLGGPIRALASDGETLVAVRAKPVSIVGYRHDASATLVAIQSPTTSDPGGLALWWVVATLVVGFAAYGLGRLLTRRTPLPMTFPDHDPLEEDDG